LLTGCDPFHRQTVRSTAEELADEPPPEESATTLTGKTKGFFRNGVSSGGWSSQAREIERDLGAQ
jgi:hypothetical protein